MTPLKRICGTVEACSFGKVCKYKLLRTVCNSSSLEMNSEIKKKTKDMGDHTGCCCAEFSNSISQNPRIRSNNHTKTRSQEGKTGQGEPGKATKPERKSAGYHSATVVPDSYPNSLSLVRRNSNTITSSLLRTRHVFIDPYSSTITKLSTHCTAAAACLCFK